MAVLFGVLVALIIALSFHAAESNKTKNDVTQPSLPWLFSSKAVIEKTIQLLDLKSLYRKTNHR
jgi:hypothetical protein